MTTGFVSFGSSFSEVTERHREGVLAVSAVLAVLFKRGTFFREGQGVLKRANETGGFEGSF
ncbi:MAG: hypothetical protein ACYC67_23210 [Prosthecobacter sp.]